MSMLLISTDNPHTHMSTQTYRAEIVVRSLAPHGVNERQRAIIEQVESFGERGVLDRVNIEVWGQAIRADSDERTAAHARYEALERWAEGTGYTLAPGFARRRRASLAEEGLEEVISFPLICLVLYAVNEGSNNDAVRAVFPCSDEDQTYTIVDGIEALEHRAVLSELKAEAPPETKPAEQRALIESL
jgi:hypothetical protein